MAIARRRGIAQERAPRPSGPESLAQVSDPDLGPFDLSFMALTTGKHQDQPGIRPDKAIYLSPSGHRVHGKRVGMAGWVVTG